MDIRDTQIHIASKLKRALWYVAQAQGKRTDPQGFERIATEEEVAEKCLWEMIERDYPKIIEHQKKQAVERKALIDSLAREIRKNDSHARKSP